MGGYFGPRENCTVQTAATASGGLGILFVSGVPAMYQLGLLSKYPKGEYFAIFLLKCEAKRCTEIDGLTITSADDIRKLILFTMAGAFFGMAFAIPMRKQYVVFVSLLALQLSNSSANITLI